jgi:hypothetical protein
MKRITRNRRLTPEEAAKYKKIRAQVTGEQHDVNVRIRAKIAAKQRTNANRSRGEPGAP